MIVGNKSDRSNKNEREVDYEAAVSFAEKLGFKFLETSAKDDVNVDRMFMTMAAELKEKLGCPVNDEKEVVKIGTSVDLNQQPRYNCCNWV